MFFDRPVERRNRGCSDGTRSGTCSDLSSRSGESMKEWRHECLEHHYPRKRKPSYGLKNKQTKTLRKLADVVCFVARAAVFVVKFCDWRPSTLSCARIWWLLRPEWDDHFDDHRRPCCVQIPSEIKGNRMTTATTSQKEWKCTSKIFQAWSRGQDYIFRSHAKVLFSMAQIFEVLVFIMAEAMPWWLAASTLP